MRGWVFAIAAFAALLLVGPCAADEPKSSEELFEEGVSALLRDDAQRAVAVFEMLADRGYSHPDVSYNRGMAYVARVRAKQGRPGDLGRAAAGFEEVLLSRPSDDGAQRALEVVRAEVARTRPKGGGLDVDLGPSLGRMVLGIVSETGWAWAALVGSVVLSVGLVLRRLVGAMHLAGTIAVSVGMLVLVLCGGAAGWSRHLRNTTVPAVVVVAEARILDEMGAALPKELPIPEAARVEVVERRGSIAKVRYGQREGWTHGSSLHVLASPGR